MIINNITLTNFNNYEGTHSFNFKKLNLIKGKNGSGKSTLAVDSILFALFGYNERPLSSIPTRGISDTCEVILNFDYRGHNYIITRKYPTELIICQDGAKISLARGAKQGYLNDLFKNTDYFRKFRMVDVKKGINLLEEGKSSLKKTLVSFNDSILNNIRQRLLDKKKDREIFNKDTAVIYHHFPSKKRLEIINDKLESLGTFAKIKNYKQLQDKYYTLCSEYDNLKYKESLKHTEINKLLKLNTCPTCKQEVPNQHKNIIVDEWVKEIDLIIEEIGIFPEEINKLKENLKCIELENNKDRELEKRLTVLKTKLETRLKQKDYIWTNKDVEIVKKAINELDSFYSFYLVESVKSLEPIVNNIIGQIGYQMVFEIDKKGEFDIKLNNGKDSFTYKDLSDGQRLILTIAFQIALLMDKGEEGLIIADEGLSSLDQENIEYVFNLFKNIPFQLIAIVHRYEQASQDVNMIELVNQ